MPQFFKHHGPSRPPTMFATTEYLMTRTIAACDEALSHNCDPRTRHIASRLKDDCALMLSACELPSHRVETPVDEDTSDAKGAPSAA